MMRIKLYGPKVSGNLLWRFVRKILISIFRRKQVNFYKLKTLKKYKKLSYYWILVRVGVKKKYVKIVILIFNSP